MSELPDATHADVAMRLAQSQKANTQQNHQKFWRATIRGEVCFSGFMIQAAGYPYDSSRSKTAFPGTSQELEQK
jgi:hypothetical protein